jgi:response regulator RpfG family c-di-GMP phosphodiesterase
MNEKILFVDDDSNLLDSMERSLRRQFRVDTALGAEAGLATMAKTGPYAVVFSDRQMPNMDGIQFLARVREQSPNTVRIMLTGNVDLEQAGRAVNEGNIFRFLVKPCPQETLIRTVESALAQYRLVTAEKELLDKTLSGSIKLLTDILSMVDVKSFGRAERLRDLITKISEKISLTDLWQIHLAALLSPIGYVTLPSDIVIKAREGAMLSKPEEQLVEATPEIAARLLGNIPRLEGVAKIARYQHKRFDGGGFPTDTIQGEAIPFGARLLKILNDMLQLEAKGDSQSEAWSELTRRKGWYDPNLLASLEDYFGLLNDKPDKTAQTISIEANNLAVGMLLTSDVYTRDGTLILSAGHYINGMILERVHNFNLIYGIKEPIFVRMPKTALHLKVDTAAQTSRSTTLEHNAPRLPENRSENILVEN